MSTAAPAGVQTTSESPRLRIPDLLAFAALAYIPFLLSSPGKVSGDTKQYLYLDPGRLLSRAVYLWDPHVGTGTVPHQNVGYLFPMGPYYWLMDQVGVPDWVAQRLWMGSISFAAAAGALWLFTLLGTRRSGAIAGAVVFMLTPYQVAFNARLSVLLLPFAGLPWLVGLTIRAAKRGGWRDPCLFALVVLLIGGTNASSLVLVGIAPVLWLVVASVQREIEPRVALGTAGRIALPTVGVSLWWAAGLVSQARYGIPVLDVTENLRQVAAVSRPADLLRGLGNWFLSGSDRLGPWLDQANAYRYDRLVTFATFAVPIAGLVAAAAVRWRHRAYFIALVVVGTIVGVGAWPYDDPSPIGSMFKTLIGRNGAAAALRNTPRVAPLIVLGIAGLIAAGVSALHRKKVLELGSAVAVCVVVAVAFLPVWRHGYLSERILRDEDVPAYWHDVASTLDRGDDGTRALELPGSLFAAYRWGNTVDPITPGLTDRPWVARELMPFGTRGSVDLLAALDRQMQSGTFEPAALAPLARLLAVGTIVDRNDLQYERYDTPRPRDVWAWLDDPLAPGLAAPRAFGSRTPNRASAALPMLDEIELRASGKAWPPRVALFPVASPRRIVSTASTHAPVVLEGDGEGVVDAAAAGLVDGKGILFYGASLDQAELRRALHDDADLIVTDTARRRARRWDTLRDDVGLTERAGQHAIGEDVNDFRYEITDNLTDGDRTVVETKGAKVDATAYGDRSTYIPSERPALAFDGDLRTAWRVAGGDVPNGDRLELRLHTPVRTDGITLVQPLDADRVITKVRVRLDGGAPIDVALGDASRTEAGQRVTFPARRVQRIDVEPLEVSAGPSASVGFAEVRLDGVARGTPLVDEVVRVPSRLLRRAGPAAARRNLGFVFTRARTDPAQHGRTDEELALVRRFELPSSAGAERGFTLSGVARLDPNAPDATLDVASGTTTPGVEYRASGHRAGDARARASRAFDGSAATAWDAPFGEQVGQWVEADLAQPTSVEGGDDHSRRGWAALGADEDPRRGRRRPGDERRGPTDRRRRERGGDPSGPVPVRPGDRESAAVRRRVGAGGAHSRRSHARPAGGAGRDRRARGHGSPACSRHRRRAHDVSRRSAPHRRRADRGAAQVGETLEACDGPLTLASGSHVLRSGVGLDTGIDIDRVVLTSGADGAAVPPDAFRSSSGRAGARVRVVESGATTYDLQVRSAGKPFWLVLGQSHSEGWKAEVSGSKGADGSLGAPRLVNGYANGWLVDPGGVGHLHDPPEVDAAEPRVGRVRGIGARDPRVSRRRVRHAPPRDSRCRGDAGADVTDALRGRVAVVAGILRDRRRGGRRSLVRLAAVDRARRRGRHVGGQSSAQRSAPPRRRCPRGPAARQGRGRPGARLAGRHPPRRRPAPRLRLSPSIRRVQRRR